MAADRPIDRATRETLIMFIDFDKCAYCNYRILAYHGAVFYLPKNARGRPPRDRILSETVWSMRQDGRTLREIQQWINANLRAQGKPERRDEGQNDKGRYYRAARRWTDCGGASLAAFRGITDETEALIESARRCREALRMLDRIAAGELPLVDDHGNVTPPKPHREQRTWSPRNSTRFNLSTRR